LIHSRLCIMMIKDKDRNLNKSLSRRSLSVEDCDEKARGSLQSSTERLQRGGSEEVLIKQKI